MEISINVLNKIIANFSVLFFGKGDDGWWFEPISIEVYWSKRADKDGFKSTWNLIILRFGWQQNDDSWYDKGWHCCLYLFNKKIFDNCPEEDNAKQDN